MPASDSASREIALTLDVDWAPDWIIDSVAGRLVRAGVRATWFATHLSPAIARLQAAALFEVAPHPNFLSGSSHGDSPETVLRTVREWFPHATAVRTHSLFQSERLMQLMTVHGFRVDCSLHLPQASHVVPHRLRFSTGGPWLTRVPHVFQDNMHMLGGGELGSDPLWLDTPGLKVMDFHPLHIALNSIDISAYERLKAEAELPRVQPQDIARHVAKGFGIACFFDAILERLQRGSSRTVSEIAGDLISGQPGGTIYP